MEGCAGCKAPRADGPDGIHPGRALVNLAVVCAVAGAFNILPEKVGILVSATNPSSFLPLLAPEFQEHMPWLNLYWALAIGLSAVNLALTRECVVTRWADVALSGLAALVMMRLVLGGPISAYPAVTWGIKAALLVALLWTGFGVGRKAGALLVSRDRAPVLGADQVRPTA